MNKIVNRDDYLQALESFKQGEYDANRLIRKFDEFLSSTSNMSDQFLSDIQSLIAETDLPDDLSEQLLNTISDKTRIVMPPSPDSTNKSVSIEAVDIKSVASESVESDKTSEKTSDTHSSSLFNELLKWNQDDADQKIETGQIIRDTYRLVSRIGKGGMGEVWKAVDLIQDAGDSSDKYVAIKFINQEIRQHPYALKALVREFARYKQLIHPNIVKAYEINRDKNNIFIVMEYLEGLPLKTFIRQHPDGISLAEAKPIIGGICKALSYAHHEGIIHLDLKPGNVFYDPEMKKAKVIDFGIARLSDPTDRDKTRFDPGTLGAISTAYASVEMLLEEDPDPRDDIYSLACIAYELIAGKHVFNGAMATKAERAKMTPEPLKALKKAEFQAILNGLDFNRSTRTPLAEQFFQDLYQPQNTTKQKRSRWFILAPALLLFTIMAPVLITKGYDAWKKHQIIEAIAQHQPAGIEQFQALPINKQMELLVEDDTLLSLVQFSITQATPESDPIHFLHDFQPEIQALLFKNLDVRKVLINYYIEHINQYLASNEFNQAIAYSISITEKYPDSKNLAEQMEKITSWKTEHLSQLENNYSQCIKDNSKTLLELMPCLQTTLKVIRKLSPQHKILSDPKLTERYQHEISVALNNGRVSHAEKLLTSWLSLFSTEFPEQKESANQINHQKRVRQISKQITNSTDAQMPEMIDQLITLGSITKNDVLIKPAVKQKILAYFNQSVTADIKKQQYTSAFKQVETAFNLFSDLDNQQQNLQQLNNKILKYKNQYLNDLSKKYDTLINSEKLNIKALQNLQHQISSIDPENPLRNYPGLSKVLAKQTGQAINNEQFELAQTYLDAWQTMIPAENQSQKRLELISLYQQQLSSYEKIIDYEKHLQDALQSEQLTTVNTVIDDLQSSLSEQQQQRVIKRLQTQIIAFYQKQIQAAIDRDHFKLASIISLEALELLPEEPSLTLRKNQIENEKTERISKLIKTYQQQLNTETVSGKQIFAPLATLRSIDSLFLENNPQVYQELKTRLMALAKNEQSLYQLQDITNHWEQFFNGTENSQKAKKIYHQTRNLIALRCLYTARQLVQQKKQATANGFLKYALSLEPIISVQKALKKELEKTEVTEPRISAPAPAAPATPEQQ